jgi:RHS repeat-associated protein
MTLPGTSPLARDYTSDRLPESQTLPSGAKTTSSYEANTFRLAGRADTPAGGGAAVTSTAFSYLGDTRKAARESWTAGALTQHVDSEYDGDLTTKLTFSGAAEGTFTYTPTAVGMRLASMQVAAGSGAARTYAIARDDDTLVTQFGPYAVDRHPATGAARAFTDAADGTVVRSLDTEGYGELDERQVLDGATTVYDLDLDRDAAGRLTRREETISGGPAVVRAYSYDAHGRLETVSDGAGATVESYTYDADGNRTSAGGEPATYDATTGRQTAAGALSVSFGADGFLQSRGGRAFNYGPSGELLSAETAAGTVTYAYDAMGRLVRRSLGTQRTMFLYGNLENALQVTATVDEAGALTTYFYDDDGNLHALDRAGTRYRVGTDQVGTPRVVVAGDGTVAGQVERDSYGRVLARSGTVALPIGFAGGIEDPDTGLVRFGLRDYDPQTGRWTARDPSSHVGSPENLYAYANNTPTERRDPTGLWSIGVSGYYAFGGGLTFSFAEGAFGVCLEFGAGLGAAVELDTTAQPTDADTLMAEAGASNGVLGGSIALERNMPCPPNDQGPVTATFKGSAGPASVAVNTKDGFNGTQLSVAPELKLQGKIGQKECKKWATSWW